MASITYTYSLPSLLFVFVSLHYASIAAYSIPPKGIILRVAKHNSTLLHYTQIHREAGYSPLDLLVDLTYKSVYVECARTYNRNLLTFNISRCGSPECQFANVDLCSEDCGPHVFRTEHCIKYSCFSASPFHDLYLGNTFLLGWITEANFYFQSHDKSSSQKFVEIPRFIFTCADDDYFPGGIVDGVAGLGKSPEALPSQLAQTFNFSRKFSLCLSSSTKSKGWISFGDAKIPLNPKVNVTKYLKYTPFANSIIGVTSIEVNGKTVDGFNQELLSINDSGFGGMTISTTKPYTIMEESIYKNVTALFMKELTGNRAKKNVTRVASVEPFEFCYSSKNIKTKKNLGPVVPQIDLVLQNKNISWTISGANSMVKIDKQVMCLGFVRKTDGNNWSIEIGAHQIEDNLLQFDQDSSQLGFSSSLLALNTACAK
ncbi:protease [Lithospermum erythrorhizon]|uniref:Protease n=1 Tax=Lithospermum erythrorhizon TaxID=34254 RepID=A0AAV3QXR8_LITER